MAKKVDINGFPEYKDTLLSREGVFPYLGRQIDQAGRFGLKPNEIYYVYRPREEVCSEDFITSLQNLPLVNDHTMIGEDFTPAEKKGVEGVMYDVHVDEKTKNSLRGSIKVFSEHLKDLIGKGKRELSLGYICNYRRESGMYAGTPYDFVQQNLRANHVALVENARMGSDCRVMDSAMCFDSLEMTPMEKPQKSCADELIEKLKGCTDEDLAKVKDFLAASAEKKEEPAKDADEPTPKKEDEEKAEEKKEEPAKDAEPPKAEDPKPEEKKDEEPAKDAEPPKEEPSKEAACDEGLRKEIAEEYGRAVELAGRCKSAGFEISMDGLFTQKDVAMKVAALDSVKLEDITEDNAVAAVKAFIAGRRPENVQRFVTTTDSAVKKTGFDFLSAYKGK